MLPARIGQLLAAPVFKDEEKTRVAGLLNAILLTGLAVTTISNLTFLVILSGWVPSLVIHSLVTLSALGALWLTRRGHVRLANVLFSSTFWIIITLLALSFGGVSGITFTAHILVILITGFLLSARAGIIFAGLSTVAGLGLLYLELNDVLSSSFRPLPPTSALLTQCAYFSFAAGLLYFFRRSFDRALERARNNERHLLAEVTERARAEEEIRQLKEFNESIVQSMAEGILVEDAEGYYTFVNPAAAAMLGYTPDELLGQHWTAIVAPDQHPLVREANTRRAQKKADQYELGMVRQDGTRLTVLVSGSPFFEGQRFSGTLAVLTDITERKQAEQELQRRNEELEALWEISLTVTAQLERDELLRSAVERGCRLLNVKTGGVYLFDKERGDLELVVSHGFAQDHAGTRLAPGAGIAGKVLQSGAPLTTNDYSHWEGRASKWDGKSITAALGVPLKHGEQIIGVIGFSEIHQTRYFDEHDIWLATLFANQAAIAITNAQLFEEVQHELAERKQAEQALQQTKNDLEQQNVRLSTLYRVGQLVNSTLETDAILDQLTDEAMRVTRATHGQVLVVREQEGCFERRSQRGFTPKEVERARNAPLPLDRGINGQAYATHQSVRVDDVQAEPDYFPLIPTTRSELAVPIIREGKVLGNLDLQSPQAGAFRDVNLDYLKALADQVAVALTNARLFEQTQIALTDACSRAGELAILNQLVRSLSARLDVKGVVDEIYQGVSRLMDTSTAYITLYDADREEITAALRAYQGQVEKPFTTRPINRGGLTEYLIHARQPLLLEDRVAERLDVL